MADFLEELDKITNPPEKVLLMYQAVLELLNEKKNIALVKVIDITNRAGIGKGTAYEYFSSKEEIINNALLYAYCDKFYSMVENVGHIKGFKEQFFKILEWLSENLDCSILFTKIIQIISGNDDSEITCFPIAEEMKVGIAEYIIALVKSFMKRGMEEKIITEQDERKRVLAFLTAIMEYGFSIKKENKSCVITLEDTEMREFVYQSMIKALN